MQHNASNDPGRGAKHEDEVAKETEGNAGKEDPFESEAGHQVCQHHHDQHFGDLAKSHDSSGTRDTKLLEVSDAVGVEGGERDGVESGGDKNHAVIGVTQQIEGIETQDLLPSTVGSGVGWRNDGKSEGEGGDNEPKAGCGVTAKNAGIGMKDVADEPASGHPTDGGPGTNGSELTARVF